MDSVLVQGGRDRTSLRRLIQQYQQPVGSYLVHLVGERDVALELTQETFVRAHRAQIPWRTISGGLAVRPWLYRVATRLAYAYLRRHQSRLAAMPGREPDRRLPVLAATESGEREWVQSVLYDLPLRERTVLLLCDLEHLPVEEAAAVLNVDAERLRARLGQARTHFRRAYVSHDALASHAQNGSLTGGGDT